MRHRLIILAIGCCLLLGCAAYSKQGKIEQFGRTLDAYEKAMRVSDLDSVCRFVDASVMSRQDCLNRFGDIKLVDYKVMDVDVDKENLTVHQDIKVAYHSMDHYRIKEQEYKQTWQYQENHEEWFLQDAPPKFP